MSTQEVKTRPGCTGITWKKSEIQWRINELFNLVDNSFVQSDDRMHAFKLGRSAPKVSEDLDLFVILLNAVLFG
jgi:hypothetical protein